MKLKHENYDKVTVVSVEGEITADDVNALVALVDDRIEHNTRDFVFDIHRVEFIDSKGLETLIAIQDKAGENLGQVRLVQPAANVVKIFEITRLENYFDTHADLDSALKSLH